MDILFIEVRSVDIYNDNYFIPLGMAMAVLEDEVDHETLKNMTEAEKEELLNRAKDQKDREKVRMILDENSQIR